MKKVPRPRPKRMKKANNKVEPKKNTTMASVMKGFERKIVKPIPTNFYEPLKEQK